MTAQRLMAREDEILDLERAHAAELQAAHRRDALLAGGGDGLPAPPPQRHGGGGSGGSPQGPRQHDSASPQRHESQPHHAHSQQQLEQQQPLAQSRHGVANGGGVTLGDPKPASPLSGPQSSRPLAHLPPPTSRSPTGVTRAVRAAELAAAGNGGSDPGTSAGGAPLLGSRKVVAGGPRAAHAPASGAARGRVSSAATGGISFGAVEAAAGVVPTPSLGSRQRRLTGSEAASVRGRRDVAPGTYSVSATLRVGPPPLPPVSSSTGSRLRSASPGSAGSSAASSLSEGALDPPPQLRR